MESIKLNAQQIKNTLRYIGDTQCEAVKRDIFGELGCQCYRATGTADFLERFRGRPEAYLRGVNEDHAVPYWESILPGGDGQSYVLTGAPVDRCVCSFADGQNTPMALCEYCCKSFQEHLFGTLFDREVEVEITDTFLKGGGRCSAVIRFV